MLTVALIHDARLPVVGYGGAERAFWWLGKGLAEQGARVILGVRAGSSCPFADVHPIDFGRPLGPQLPEADLLHFFFTPSEDLGRPTVVTIQGNGKPDETFHPNTVFLCRNHAERHGAEAFVYTGLDPDEVTYRHTKGTNLLFLAKASWRVKNVKGAIRVARAAKRGLHIAGGSRWWLPRWRGVTWEGMIDGPRKRELLAESAALLFPVLWHEPFGIAIVEALASGTPVVGTPFGSLPELVGPEVGRICRSEEEMVEAVEEIRGIAPETCRDWAHAHFHYAKTAQAYRTLYEAVLAGRTLNVTSPKTRVPPEAPFPIPRRTP